MNRILERLKKPCSVCDARDFGVHDNILSLVGSPTNAGAERELIPFAAVRCNDCGHLLLFSLETLKMDVFEIPHRGPVAES